VPCRGGAGIGVLGGKLLVAWCLGAVALFSKVMRTAGRDHSRCNGILWLRLLVTRERSAGHRRCFSEAILVICELSESLIEVLD
jgi:hypothetical protein